MFSSCCGGMPKGGMEMDHRQDYPERDELRAKFTRWLEKVIKRAKIDYLRKYENRPEIIRTNLLKMFTLQKLCVIFSGGN